jgi:ribokinase
MEALNRKIIVIGSFNTDMVVKAVKFPLPGETVLGGQFLMNPGGKGANQAIAAARLGADVTFIAKVGNDMFGRVALQQFKKEKIDCRYITMDPDEPSGVAIINVDDSGETRIAVSPGANNNLRFGDVDPALESAEEGTIVLMQLEIPIEVVEYVILKCHQLKLRVVLNPAPVQNLSKELFPYIYALVPNEVEASALTGVEVKDTTTAGMAALKLKEMGVQHVVITLGAQGAYVNAGDIQGLIPAPRVEVVDSTGAGDSFCGAFATALSEDFCWDEAVLFAGKVAAISVKSLGAQTSIPYRREVEAEPGLQQRFLSRM